MGELIDAKELGAMAGWSDRTVRRKDRAGAIPRSIKISGSVRWRHAEIDAWIAAGCPPRKEWEKINKSK
jgi:predicted DNA-binding transcriptional regulator AlpA